MKKLKQLAGDRVLRYQIEMWIWVAFVPVTVTLWKESVLWIAVMSIYNNIRTASANAEAAKK